MKKKKKILNPRPLTLHPSPFTLQPTPYRGTSLIRNSAPIGPYGRTMHRALWWVLGGGSLSYERGTPVENRLL